MLWLLAVTGPLLSWFLWWAWRKKQALIAQFVQSRLLAQLTVGVSARRQKFRMVALAGSVACILLALARPQFGFAWEEVKQRGLDIVVAIDTSRSMLANDAAPNRLTRAKLAAHDLLRVARTDRLGLVSFAGTAFLQCPLTLDDDAFRQSLNSLEVGIIPQGGTAITEAIDTALTAFKEGEDNYKVLVLFTDGEDHDGGAVEAARKAAKAGLKIFTVGVGTPEGERLRVVDDQGRTTYVRDEAGKEVTSKLDEGLLRQIAQAGNGDYLLLRGPRPIEMLYEARLAPLPKSDLSARHVQQYFDRFQWPLALAILLLVLESSIPARKRVFRPENAGPANVPVAGKAFVSAILLASCVSASASPAKAMRAYEEGQFREAHSEYERLLKKQPNDARLHFNAGTALYRAKQYDQATNEFGAAILSSDPALLSNAYYNQANTLYRLGEQAPDPATRMENWKQSVQHYDSALKLNSQDADAKFNREIVSKKLEELKQQQPQSQSKNDKDQKDQKDKQDQDKSQQGDKQNEQSQKDQSQEKKDESKRDDASHQQKDEQQKEQEKQAQDQSAGDSKEQKDQAAKSGKDDPDKPKPVQEAKKDGDHPDEGDQAEPAAGVAGQMTPEQARQLLEAAKADEKTKLFGLPQKPKRQDRAFKDW